MPRPRSGSAEMMLSVRVPTDLVDRADALIDPIEADTERRVMASNVSRSAVLRLALLEGIRMLERQYLKKGR